MSRSDIPFARDGNLAQVVGGFGRKLLRHKLLFVTVALVVTLLGAGATLSLRPKFTAQATIAVLPDIADPLGPAPSEAQSLRDDEVATQARLITSMDLARTVVQKTGFADAISPGPFARWPVLEQALCAQSNWAVIERICAPGRAPTLQDRVSQFLDSLTAFPVPRTRVIELSLTNSSPELTAETLNSLIKIYQQEQIAQRTADLARTAQWVSSRAEELRQVWLAAEQRAGSVRSKNGLLPGGSGPGQPLIAQQVVQAANALGTAKVELATARARLGEFNGSVGSQDKLAAIRLPDEPTLIGLASQLVTLRAKRASLQSSQGDLNPTVMALERQIALVNSQFVAEQTAAIGRLSADLRAKAAQVAEAERTLEQLRSGASDVTARSVSLNTLDDEAKSARAVFETFLARARQLDDRAPLLRPQVQVASQATVPATPSSPNVPRFLAGSFVFGLLSGTVVVLLREGFSKGFRDLGLIAAQVGLPLICCIPVVRSRRERRSMIGFGSNTNFSAVTEAIRTLAARLALPPDGDPPNSVAIVSATSQEGKTTTALWLAASIARSGRRVLVVDGDHRRGAVGSHLGDNTGQGLSDIIFDGAAFRSCIKRERGGSYDFINAGRPTARPFGRSEIARMRNLLERLRPEYDLIVVDTPPMLAMPEVLLYATAADATVLMCRWQSTAPQAVFNCAERLRECGARLLGVALTMVDHDRLAQFSEEYSAKDLRLLKQFYITD